MARIVGQQAKYNADFSCLRLGRLVLLLLAGNSGCFDSLIVASDAGFDGESDRHCSADDTALSLISIRDDENFLNIF